MQKRTSVRTKSNIEIDLLNPDPDCFLIEDIGHQLCGLERYNGAGKFSLTVGYHSVIGIPLLPKEARLDYLFHDSPEMILGDVVTPLKYLLPEFCDIRRHLMAKIDALLLKYPTPEVRAALRELVIAIEEMKEMFPGYREIERRVMAAIAKRYDLKIPRPPIVKQVDTALQVAEMIQVMNWPDLAAAKGVPPADVVFVERTREDVYDEFMGLFHECGGRA